MTTIKLTIPGRPITKKNSPRIVKLGRRYSVRPSKAYEQYEAEAGWHLGSAKGLKISQPVNMQCVYYMTTKQRVDLANLISASCDILVKYGVLEDDNSNIVATHDGSCVRYDKDNPRAEITLTPKEEM